MSEELRRYSHFIDGEWYQPDHAEIIDSVDPATGEVWVRFVRGDEDDADCAIQSAHRAFAQWSSESWNQRSQVLLSLADALEARWEELVEPEIFDNGKRITEVRGQFSALHTWYRYFAQLADGIGPDVQSNSIQSVTSETQYVPYGVVVAITPWNSPLMILAWKIAPALIAGNTVVVKPSEFASASTLEFAKIAFEAGIPRGVLNVVTGYGEEAGKALVRHPLTRKVTFTGSDQGGRRVAQSATENIVPVTLELGGKSPQIVLDDADITNALNGILSGIFLSNGQTCVAGSRLIVHEQIKDRLLDAITACANSLKAGSPLDPETQIGPLANRMQLEKVMEHIDTAKREGAQCIAGGNRVHPDQCPNGYFVQPTVFDGVEPQMRLWQEEVFGPVLAVSSFSDEDRAVTLANSGKYGLAAGIWSSDLDRANRIAARIQAGTVYINHYRSVDPASPIGGMKSSGYGRELGPDAIKDFLQTKSVWTGMKPMPDPYSG